MTPTDPLPPAVVFDCDGTLADTETIADRAWEDALRPFGYDPTAADFAAIIGQPWHRCWAYFSERVDLGDEDEFRARIGAVFAERFERDLELYDDALETVRVLADAGVRIAVASSSRREQVVAVLERGDLTGLVQAVVGQQDVSAHKPDPEPYLTAARLLEVDPTRCAAVEDTPVGVAAAVAAGMFTVGILRRSTDPSELGAAHRVVRRITVPALTPAWGTAPR
jgi:HAD superfamily hydrolase (TIGR01509 family)